MYIRFNRYVIWNFHWKTILSLTKAKHLTDNRLACFISFRLQILTLLIFISHSTLSHLGYVDFVTWIRDVSRIQASTIRNEMNVLERGIRERERERKKEKGGAPKLSHHRKELAFLRSLQWYLLEGPVAQ